MTQIMGYNSVGGSTDLSAANSTTAIGPYSVADGGILQPARFYCKIESGVHFRIALYLDAGGEPVGSPVAISAEGVTVADSWVEVSFPTPYQILPNTLYWIAFILDGQQHYPYTGATGAMRYGYTTTYPTFPAPWPAANVRIYAERVSLYVTYYTTGHVPHALLLQGAP